MPTHMKPSFSFRLRATVIALCTAGLLAGCGNNKDGDDFSAKPLEINRSTSCSLDGMLLADYPGPKAQIHYDRQTAPDFFCDTMEMFNTVLNAEQARRITAIYVQDMGKADWTKPVGHWIDAKTAFYVLGSKQHGSMGPTIGSFGSIADAQSFAQTYGGKVLRFDEVTADQVNLDGGALHDHSM